MRRPGRPLPWRRIRWTRRRVIVTSIVAALLFAGLVWAALPSRASYTTHEQMLTVHTGPNGSTPIELDTTYYEPRSASAAHPVPAVLLAHGFGGTKYSVATQAEDLADRGYAVMTWTAEGFDNSGGQIHVDSPDWEIKDGSQLIDWLAARPEIEKDHSDDPRVAAVGGSYGGAFALLLAAYDKRVDAIVPMITWNDLAKAFLPSGIGAPPTDGVFKKAWAGLFFGSSGSTQVPSDLDPSGSNTPGGNSSGGNSSGGNPSGTPPEDPACGRFAPDICHVYLSIGTTGQASPADIALLERSSPASVINRITAPTLLIQGEADSLFPLSEADANARELAANGTPVRVAWYTGGHDGGDGPQSDQDRLNALTDQWLDHYLRDAGSAQRAGSGTGSASDAAPPDSFSYSRIAGLDATSNGVVATAFDVPTYPGLGGQSSSRVTIEGPPQTAANPPNGTPAAISSLPGRGGGVASFVRGVVTDVPGQHADFYSPLLTHTVDVVGSPTVSIKVASATGTAVVFVKLYDVDPDGSLSLPDGLVAPVRLTGLPANIAQARPVTVTLPAIVHRFEAGHALRLTVAASDQAYATPAAPTVYTIALAGSPSTVTGSTSGTASAVDGSITLPSVHGVQQSGADAPWWWALGIVVAAIAIGLVAVVAIARRRTRSRLRTVHPEYADVPLVVRGLRKEYGSFVAVATLDLEVRRGQVLGLLGPNGAGKTTTLRVLMGLTQPTLGEIYVFGHRLAPGSPVLSRLGALVEGPGFMPHLTGRENLALYWRSTGRPLADARMAEALDIAGLGAGIDRRVRAYSHGMKQRLAIAQAMLGLPELLVLDEPTDGLDPPQIAEMRRVLRRYATGGRAVLVSSHLLAEVEQTCTHVAVMHKGEKVADGPVEEIVGDSPTVQLDVSDVTAAQRVLAEFAGVETVESNGTALVVNLDGTARAEVVAALVRAGVGVDRVAPRRRLEDAFLALVGGDTKASGER
ncbi:MAG TPA: alpha/beta fold hydrolase [Micromonosporaceae bacterium]|nr:alpha/beta fold hydrolase [Micromonosporaceae bacterium]